MTETALVDEETRRVIGESAAQAEALLRSRKVSLIAAGVMAAMIAAAVLLGPDRTVAGELSLGHVASLIGVTWALMELASLAYRRFGPAHLTYRIASMLDETCRSALLMSALVVSGSASGFFLLLSLSRGFVRHAPPPEQQQRTWAAQVLGHLSVASVCVAVGRPASAMMILLAFGAFATAFLMTAYLERASVRVHVERDLLERAAHELQLGNLRGRMAREVHDGVGADIMALVLQLRRVAKSEHEAAALSDEAQSILEDLRGVVWSLRSEQGTLGELAKLLDGRCARLRRELRYERAPTGDDSHRHIPAETALAVLRVASELVGAAAAGGASCVRLALEAGEALELRVQAVGAQAAFGASSTASVRELLEESGATLSSRREEEPTLRVRFPLAATATARLGE